MKVWWCEEHECTAEPHTVWCVARFWAMDAYETRGIGDFEGSECRIVEMQLVPADARIVSEEAIVANVVAVIHRGTVEGKEFAEPWRITACTEKEPQHPKRYLLVEMAEEPPKDPWDYEP